jgi:hypothetical protein
MPRELHRGFVLALDIMRVDAAYAMIDASGHKPLPIESALDPAGYCSTINATTRHWTANPHKRYSTRVRKGTGGLSAAEKFALRFLVAGHEAIDHYFRTHGGIYSS